MPLELRHEPAPPANDVLIIHMGAGDASRVVPTVLAAHDAWFPILGQGRFAFSVYGASTEPERDAIISSFKFGKYGTATVADVTAAGLQLVATNTLDLDDDVLAAIQRYHYSVVIGEGLTTPLIEASEETLNALSAELERNLDLAFSLFFPREPNPLKRKN
jgi:hypothetical protein